jgi:hypothetical protein
LIVRRRSPAAHANNCETFPGSQQYTDQGCDKPYDNSAASQQNGAGATPPNPSTGLRHQLRRALSEGSTKPNPKTASTALANAVANARSGVRRALDEAANAPEPKQLAKAQRDYKAAMTKLDRAYDAAAGSGKKAVCLVDIRTVPGGTSGHTTTVDATLYFFNTKMDAISKMSGHGEAVVPYPAISERIQPSTDAAVQQLDAKLSALLR